MYNVGRLGTFLEKGRKRLSFHIRKVLRKSTVGFGRCRGKQAGFGGRLEKMEVAMIHFKEMPYERVSYEELEGRYRPLMEELRKAAGAEACMAVLKKRYELTADMTAMDLCYVRHDMDVNDAFYAAEQDYYDEIGPKLNDLSNQLDRLILDSPYRTD